MKVSARIKRGLAVILTIMSLTTVAAVFGITSTASAASDSSPSIEDMTWRLAPPSAGERKFLRVRVQTTVRVHDLGIRVAEGPNFVKKLAGPLGPGTYTYQAARVAGCGAVVFPSFDVAAAMGDGSWSWSQNRFRTYTAQCLDSIRRSAGVTCPQGADKTFMVTVTLASGDFLREPAIWYRLVLANGKSLVSRGQLVAPNSIEFHFTAPWRGAQPSVAGMDKSWGVFRQAKVTSAAEAVLTGNCQES